MKLAMRVLLLAVLALVVVFAAFNPALVRIDALVAGFDLPLGVALVGVFALGSIVGAVGLYLVVVLRLKGELRRSRATAADPVQ